MPRGAEASVWICAALRFRHVTASRRRFTPSQRAVVSKRDARGPSPSTLWRPSAVTANLRTRLARLAHGALPGPLRERSETDFAKQTGIDAAGDLIQRLDLHRRQYVEYEPANLPQVDGPRLHQL